MPTQRFQRDNSLPMWGHIRPDLDMMRRIKAAFEVLKAKCFRTSSIDAKGYKHGPNLWQKHHHKARDALRGCSKKQKTVYVDLGPMANDGTCQESQLAIHWSDAWVRYLDHIAKIDISH